MSHSDHARRLGSALTWSIVARILRLVLGLVGTALVLRVLGTFNYGILAQVRTVLAFLAVIMGAGLAQGLLRYLPAWWLARDRATTTQAIGMVLVTQILLWAGITAIVVALRPVIEAWTHNYTAPVIILGVALLLPETLANTFTQISNAFYDTKRISLGVLASSVTYVLVLWVLLDSGGAIRGVLIAAAVSSVVMALVLVTGVSSYLRREPPPGRTAKASPPRVGRVFRYSMPFVVIGILNLITWRQSEVLFLGHYLGAEAAGFFDIAYRLPQTVLEFIPGAIWPLVMAGTAEAYLRNPDALQRTSSAYYKLLFLLVAPLAIGGFLVGDRMIVLLGGPEYAAAGIYCQVMFLVISVSFFATPLSMVFYVVERPGVGMMLYVVNAVVNVGLDILLIPRIGIWGAAIPVALVILASPFLNAWALRRIGLSIRPPIGFLVRIHLASLLMLLLWPARGMISGVGELVVFILAGALLFLLGVRLFRVVGPDERDLMQRTSPAAWSVLEPILAGRKERP